MFDHEAAARALLSTPRGGKIIKGLDKFNEICRTPAGREILSMLSGAGGDALKKAAAAACSEGAEPGRAAISALLSSNDGTMLAAKLIELSGI